MATRRRYGLLRFLPPIFLAIAVSSSARMPSDRGRKRAAGAWHATASPTSEEDYDCPVCLELLVDPVVISGCGHDACKHCLRRWLAQGQATCPTCRTAIVPATLPRVCLRLARTIETLFPARLQERRAQLAAAGRDITAEERRTEAAAAQRARQRQLQGGDNLAVGLALGLQQVIGDMALGLQQVFEGMMAADALSEGRQQPTGGGVNTAAGPGGQAGGSLRQRQQQPQTAVQLRHPSLQAPGVVLPIWPAGPPLAGLIFTPGSADARDERAGRRRWGARRRRPSAASS